MKIGIDISQLAYPGTGVATYTENLVNNLLNIDKENEYVLFYSSLRIENKRLKIENIKHRSNIKNFRFPPIFLELIWNKFHILPIETFTGKLDLFHTSDWLEPPAKCPKVTTIHDLTVLKYPETFVPRGGHDIVANQKRKLDLVKKESKIIIAVSENTKKDIVELLGIPESRIKVIYEAADEIYNPSTPLKVNKIKKKYGIEGKYILAVGTREPRKNLARVIEAHSRLTRSNLVTLVIAGKYGWGSEKSNIKDKKLKILGFVLKEDLALLYSGAECFVYPPLYEGFGLPVLEAMASGCPVVTSNVSSLAEIAGKAAILVNPENVEEIVQGIEKAIKNKEEMTKKGLIRAKEFSWEKTARETLKIYDEVFRK
ncbi:hypothetical protein COT44_04765 [Candidatus Shapirobacteria bacterium CG08_land_8_20_14_0_20_39_18]|uniref:Glycosyltransferase family 1 protein n=1 Tax=Candidatus Shapirobacteria bacterium CG08_land_8_20_14_0_20_39_18 TaxID=1974883 RepID=A0A2M6XBZ0_9BACT|nr:MAG: hypothetical protein COT44_04765 [Candidatus Shapirobacteria bacterium CG08_land_8_20_14_0_20_39_18]PIY65366.1 MAG: hypothetical protein COY91_03055 [Candidatus Shapirobacteria bacterium CG_4_10_14_0_8_um_filter_39_15]PJE68575.1 MAG: hypothetical protein COU94_01195 [Candidatus Shapirobacteria bacterium CG10_big_fil_rev_8_21_14_0_10_38_8]